MRVVVVGGGFGGLASAARLAKLGHDVTLLEAAGSLGGALGAVRLDDYTWDAGVHHTLLPAVTRDLFRKSGRPLERELELEPLEFLAEHRFADGSRVRLPGGSRAAQLQAVDAGLGEGLGRQWVDHVAAYARPWELLRRDYLERPWDAALAPKELTDLLTSRETLARRVRKSLRDPRLRLIATHHVTSRGHEARDVPAWVGVHSYVGQNFGGWRVPGGMHQLAGALEARMRTRKVAVELDTPALDVVVRDGRAVGVATAAGTVDADAVVVAVDPRRIPALAEHVRRTQPAIPPVVTHVALDGADELPDLGPEGHEVVLHPDARHQGPTLVVRTGGTAPEGHAAWTVHARGRIAEDLLVALARHGIDLRPHLVDRVDRTPRDLVEQWGGSPEGVLWQGRATLTRRLGPTTPVPGVYLAGAHATPGAELPFVGLSAALVATTIGSARG